MISFKMSYERYRQIETIEGFFLLWDEPSLKCINDDTKKHIYKIYILKCVVFQRDGFKCANKLCKHPTSSLTLHHIKHKRNGGQDHPDNAATICKTCHTGFNRGKNVLKIGKITYKTDPKQSGRDWKRIKAEMKKLRKCNKHLYNIKISWEMLALLMRFLDKEYTDFDDD